MRTLVLFLLGTAILPAQSPRTACVVSPRVAEPLRALPSIHDLSKSWEERMGPRRVLARQEPGDWALQFLLQEPLLRRFQLGAEWDAAQAQYRAMPDRVLGDLLEARLTGGLQRKRSRAMLDRALATAPDSPWTHLALLEWAANPMDRDAALATKHLEDFRRLCPAEIHAYAYLDVVTDANRLAHHLRDLRRHLETKKASGLAEADLALFPTAWNWERVLAGDTGREEYRRVVAADTARIRTLALYESRPWYEALRRGYERELRDPAAWQSVEQEILDKAPRSEAAWWIEEQRDQRNAPPPDGGSRADMERYQVARVNAMRERLQRFPDGPMLLSAVHLLLWDQRAGITEAEFLRVADLALTLSARYPDQGSSSPPLALMVAEQYAMRKVRLDRVPGLIEEALRQGPLLEKHRLDSDLPGLPRRSPETVDRTNRRARDVRIRHAVASGEMDRARVMIAGLRQTLEQTKPIDISAATADQWRSDHQSYLDLAKLAGMEAQPLGVLLPRNAESAERIAVRDFKARDLAGRTWRLADLKGKVAYISIWTTWCTPCRAEMPGIEKLHQRWAARPDRVVLTISADLHPELVRSFLRENPRTFPVLYGRDIAEKFFPPVMFPQNWLIDPQGRRLDLRVPGAYDGTIPDIEALAAKIAAQR